MRKAGILEDPYEGDQPYIFISYSHIDRPEVIKIIRLLQGKRYRVWYDEGIDPGTEWDENIAEHIEKCEFFLAMISANYINSLNCKDEIKYARDLGKSQTLVYLEETQLPGQCECGWGVCRQSTNPAMTLRKHLSGNYWKQKGLSSVMKKKMKF